MSSDLRGALLNLRAAAPRLREADLHSESHEMTAAQFCGAAALPQLRKLNCWCGGFTPGEYMLPALLSELDPATSFPHLREVQIPYILAPEALRCMLPSLTKLELCESFPGRVNVLPMRQWRRRPGSRACARSGWAGTAGHMTASPAAPRLPWPSWR